MQRRHLCHIEVGLHGVAVNVHGDGLHARCHPSHVKRTLVGIFVHHGAVLARIACYLLLVLSRVRQRCHNAAIKVRHVGGNEALLAEHNLHGRTHGRVLTHKVDGLHLHLIGCALGQGAGRHGELCCLAIVDTRQDGGLIAQTVHRRENESASTRLALHLKAHVVTHLRPWRAVVGGIVPLQKQTVGCVLCRHVGRHRRSLVGNARRKTVRISAWGEGLPMELVVII